MMLPGSRNSAGVKSDTKPKAREEYEEVGKHDLDLGVIHIFRPKTMNPGEKQNRSFNKFLKLPTKFLNLAIPTNFPCLIH